MQSLKAQKKAKCLKARVNSATVHPLRKKSAAGFSSLMNARPRAATPHRYAALSFVPQFWRLEWEGASPAGLRPRVPGLLTRSSCRPHLAVSASVFCKLNTLEIIVNPSIDTTGINALCASLMPDLSIEDGQITTTSLQVAEHFGKRHADVLRAIKDLLKELPKGYRRNFALIQIETDLGMGRTRKDPAYRMTRDGFALLAMGFTGKEALQWKLAYIDAFNKMEKVLLEQRQAAALEVQTQLRAALAQSQQLVQDYDKEMDWMRLEYSGLQGTLINSQSHQIRLMRQVQSMHRSREARQAKLAIVQMTRDGIGNAQIVAATGRNLNHVRQVQYQARAAGTLPPLTKEVSTQTGLFAEAA